TARSCLLVHKRTRQRIASADHRQQHHVYRLAAGSRRRLFLHRTGANLACGTISSVPPSKLKQPGLTVSRPHRPATLWARNRSARIVRIRAVLFLVLPCLAVGCGSADQRIEPVYDGKTGKLQILKYDADGDGRFDTWSYMDGQRVVRIEIDQDEDGKID